MCFLFRLGPKKIIIIRIDLREKKRGKQKKKKKEKKKKKKKEKRKEKKRKETQNPICSEGIPRITNRKRHVKKSSGTQYPSDKLTANGTVKLITVYVCV